MTKLISLDEVSELVGMKKSAIYLRVSDGRFPSPIKLGRRCSRWNLAEVQIWLETAVQVRHAE